MRIIFVASCILRDTSNEKLVDFAASHVSELFMRGISQQDDVDCKVVNIEPIILWPNSKKAIVHRQHLTLHGCDTNSIGFINIALIKQISLTASLCLEVKKYINEADCLLLYGLTTPRLVVAQLMSRFYRCKTAFIVPDLPLPDYMNPGGGKIYKFMKMLDVRFQKKLYKGINKWCLFSEDMNVFLNVNEKDYMVIEGLVENTYSVKVEEKTDFIIAYTGGVAVAYGITEMVDAFRSLCGPYKLQIAGTGDAVEYVKKASKIDHRIEYLGALDRSEVIKVQIGASILINPRDNMPFTKYSFPSKTMEYLLAGVPVLMQHLDGIPKEYDDFLNYYFKDSLVDAINTIYENYDYYAKKAEKGQMFIKEKKNYLYQTERLIAHLSQ